ncbi:MAG: NAD(P)H-binding protein [Spirochaetes bacterium]|nr:NAD(P)H-binding protein [Spirochaetota bacterium]
MGKIIITGVDGNFGSYAAVSIMNKINKKNLIFTSPNKAALVPFQELGVETRYADYNNEQDLKEAFRGGDTLLMISLPFVGEKRRKLHKNAICSAVAAGVKKIIYTSTVGAGIRENGALVKVDHEFTENLIWTTDLKWNILRDSQYVEAMVTAYEHAVESGGVLSNNHGEGTMSLITRNDCAEAAACVAAGAGEDNKIYDITGPEQISMADLVRIGNEVTGGNVIFRNIDDDAMFKHFDSMGVPRTTAGDFSNAVFPFCSDDMVSYGKAIRLDQMSMLSDHVELLTGRKPKSLKDVFEDIDNHRVGHRTATE